MQGWIGRRNARGGTEKCLEGNGEMPKGGWRNSQYLGQTETHPWAKVIRGHSSIMSK